MIMNKKMSIALDDMKESYRSLPSELFDIISQGFIEREGCIFLKALTKADTNVSLKSFPDKTGYECFINSVHIDDYVESNYLECACLFVESL